MTGNFELLDYLIFGLYAITILGIGLWVSRDKGGRQKSAEDYFLASKSLPWWAVGASLIAANISAEQFIGMSGSGFALGLAIASYEWMAAITLLVVGKYFLPIFIEKGLYTIPEFIEKRYSANLKTILAVFWIALFVFVNLTTVLYLGGKALDTIIGVGDGGILLNSIIGLGLFAAAYSLWGGLAAVAWTDVVQVIILIFGVILNNYKIFFKGGLMKLLDGERVEGVLGDFKIITAESAFVVRTFFFIIFGWSVYLGSLLSFKVIGIGLIIIAIIYVVRVIILFIFNGKDIIPQLFLAPRGLITVLLFFAIPKELSVGAEFQGVLLFVILGSCLIMARSLVAHKNNLLKIQKEIEPLEGEEEETDIILDEENTENH